MAPRVPSHQLLLLPLTGSNPPAPAIYPSNSIHQWDHMLALRTAVLPDRSLPPRVCHLSFFITFFRCCSELLPHPQESPKLRRRCPNLSAPAKESKGGRMDTHPGQYSEPSNIGGEHTSNPGKFSLSFLLSIFNDLMTLLLIYIHCLPYQNNTHANLCSV